LNSTTSPTSCVSHWLDLDYASSDCTGSTAPMPCIRTRRLRRSTSPRTTCQGLLICVCFSMDFFHESYTLPTTLGISTKSPRAYFINSGAIPRRQLLKSAPRDNLKSTPVAPSPAPAAYCVCKLRWNLAVSGPLVLATMVPSCT
jgi:hypothetical protein